MKKTKRISVALLILVLFQTLLPFPLLLPSEVASAAIIKAQLISQHMPGFVFCQAPDSDKWIGYATITGRVEADDAGGEPEKTYVKTHVTVSPPTDKPWYDTYGNAYTYDQLSNIKPVAVKALSYSDRNASIDPDTYQIIVEGYAGKGYAQYRLEPKCGTNNFANYRFDVQVTWEGEVIVPDTPSDPAYKITGDFDILPSSTINYRDSFTLKPKNFVIPNGCTYQYHEYRIEKDGYTWTSPRINSQTADTSYSYSTYPPNVGVGSNFIQIKITAVCGASNQKADSGWIAGKYLHINSPRDNNAPVFSAGFFKEYNRLGWIPDTEVVVGTRVNLRIINDPTKDPAWPYDPDGDPITYTWDFAGSDSAWIRSLPERFGVWEHDEGHYNLIADEIGYHRITVVARDPWGGESKRTVGLNVVPPNPIPIIDGPSEVVEGRPLPEPISGSRSYSPAGRKITQYIWDNRKEVYMTPGIERISLEVVDDIGMHSLAPAVHQLTVKPDLPPIPKLDYVPVALRTTPVKVTNTSYSPDGDILVKNAVSYKYDSDNDGSFQDETSFGISMKPDLTFEFRPAKVGKYEFMVYVEEDWGKSATGTFILEVVNDNPSATFTVTGEIEQPPVNPPIPLTANQLLRDDWKTVDFNGETAKRFTAAGNGIKSGLMHTIVNADYGFRVEYDFTNTKPSNFAAPVSNLQLRSPTVNELLKFVFGDDMTIQKRTTSQILNTKYVLLKNNEEVASVEAFSYYDLEQEFLSNRIGIHQNYLYFFRNSDSSACGWSSSDGSGGRYSGRYFSTIYTLDYFEYNTSSHLVCDGSAFPMPIYGSASARLNTHSLAGSNRVTGDAEFEFVYVRPSSWSSPTGYRISRKIGLNELYAIDFPKSSYEYRYGYSSATAGAFAFPVSGDGKRMAHLDYRSDSTGQKTFLVIRNNTNGNLIAERVIYDAPGHDPSHVAILGYHEDLILIALGGYLFAYDFDFNLIWGGQDYPVNRLAGYSISKDGYLLYLTQETAGSKHVMVYFEIMDLRNGDLLSRVYLGEHKWTEAYGSVTTMPPVFMDDGKVAALYQTYSGRSNCSGACSSYSNRVTIIEGTPAINGDVKREAFSLGQFMNDSLTVKNGEFTYSLKMPKMKYRSKEHAGFSFRMQDERNMYRVESDEYQTRLVKLENGVRTVLKSVSYRMPAERWFDFKVRASGKKIRVYINNVPLLEAEDETFKDGHFGPYANKELVEFQNITYSIFPDPDMMPNVALVDQPVRYETTWSDPEDDPEIPSLINWRYVHVNPGKFLDAGDGKSGLSIWHNKTVSSPVLQFDKTGMYQVYYQGTDDPHPGYRYPDQTFSEYRKQSDEYWQNVLVHRRPVARYSLSISPINHTVVWTDTSYDPDRWINSSKYSTEATGINYRETRGILERRYFYLSPSGEMSHTKLVAPQEAGKYTVGLSVKDEYGAWSDWALQEINVTVPVLDQPPVPGFTVTPTTGYRGTVFTITSTAYDPEDGPAVNLKHEYYIRNVTEGTPETLQSTSRGSWTKTFNTLGVMEIRQVVTDSKGAVAQAVRTISVANRGPIARFTWTPEVIWEGDLASFRNTSSDPDGDPLTHEWQIRDENGVLLHTSNSLHTSFRFSEPGTYTVILKVSDGRDHDQSVRTIPVSPLTLEADIFHTPEWLAHHQERGHRTAEAPKQFYAGERMLLYAGHAAAPYDRITARLETKGRDGNPLIIETALAPSDEPGLAAGELMDERLQSLDKGLPNGMHHVMFVIRYANGVEKSVSVPFEIIGHVLGTAQVHRLR